MKWFDVSKKYQTLEGLVLGLKCIIRIKWVTEKKVIVGVKLVLAVTLVRGGETSSPRNGFFREIVL